MIAKGDINVSDSFYTKVKEVLETSQSLPEAVDIEYLRTQNDYVEAQNEIIHQISTLLKSLGGETMSSMFEKDSFLFELPQEVQNFIEARYERIDGLLNSSKSSGVEHNVSLKQLQSLKASIQRPQLKFKKQVSNENVPFQCSLKTKLNAIVPLDRMDMKSNMSILDVTFNPYEYEIREWAKNPANWIFSAEKLKVSRSLDALKKLSNIDLHWIDTTDKLTRLVNILKKENVIAIDLEHHSYRSFKGFVCLMQISTHDNDYLIDTLVLREDMHCLLDVFTDPNIVKVLHGSDYDVKWLQRDFNLYIVGLFDTGQAARALQYQSAGLAYVLSSLCSVSVNKAYQLADWRLRPLTPEMISYARQDTRYLLDVFEMQREALLMRDKLRDVLHKSADIAASCYQNPLHYEDSAHDFVLKKNLNINGEPLKVFIKLYDWRDSVARLHDESPTYIMSNALLSKLSRNPPTTLAELNETISFPDSFIEYHYLPTQLLDSLSGIKINRKLLEPVPVSQKKIRLETEEEQDEDWADVTNFSFASFSENSTALMKSLVQRNKHSPFTSLSSAMKSDEKLEKTVLKLEDQINVKQMLSRDIVTSMTEIFRVSNKNRKRNKENKRKNHRVKVQESLPTLSPSSSLKLTRKAIEIMRERERKTGESKLDTVQNFISLLNWPVNSTIQERSPTKSSLVDPSPATSFHFKPQRTPQMPKLGTYHEGEHYLRQSAQNRAPLSSSLYEPYNVHPFKTYKNTTRASLVSSRPLSPKPRVRRNQFKSHSYSDTAFDSQSFFERENNMQTLAGRVEHQYGDYDYESTLHGQTLLPQYGNAFGESDRSPVGSLDHYPSSASGSNYLSSIHYRPSNERMAASFDHRYNDTLPKTFNIDDVNSMLDDKNDDITSFSYF